MLNDAVCFKAVYIVCGYTDLRSGMDRLAALAKNFVYEVEMEQGKKIREQPAVSKAFLEDCKKVAQKYRRK